MAPESAGPRPPSERPDIARRGDQDGQTGAEHEVYGPLDIQRYVKDDDRALILYTRREPADA